MVVQKFGGTSVADPDAIRRLIDIVRAARARSGRGPAVVVSAMSGVTDTLLQIAATAGSGHQDEALSRVEQLRARHLLAARELAGAPQSLVAPIETHFDELAAVVRALAVLREVSPRTLDVVAAMGELLSSRLVTAALQQAEIPAEWVDARRAIVTNGEHTRAVPKMRETNAALRASVLPLTLGSFRRRASCRCCRSTKRPNSRTSARKCCTRAPFSRPWNGTFRCES